LLRLRYHFNVISEAEAAVNADALVATKRLKGKSYREAAEAISPKKPSAANFFKSRPTVEVVITTLPPSKKHTKSTDEDSKNNDTDSNIQRPTRQPAAKKTSIRISDEEDDFNIQRPTKWRAAKKAPITISDDDDDDDSNVERPTAQRVKKKTPKKISEDEEYVTSEHEGSEDEDAQPKTTSSVARYRSNPKGPPSSATSDYEESSAEETDSDESQGDWAGSSDEPSVRKKPSKIKPRDKRAGSSTSKTTSSRDATEGDSMEVDEPVTSNPQGKKSAKRKATDDRRAPKKQKRREDTDPWKLETSAVKRDWTLMQAPPLEMFYFSRVVVDEYTYLDGKAHALITNLTATRYWVLSGTPPIHDFGALKTIAAFLDVHLGVDDDAEGQSAQVKKRRREQTGKYPLCLV
jgi:hypothetical protein